MIYKNTTLIWLVTCCLLAITACKDKWEEHNELLQPVLGQNVLQQIKSNPELSQFAAHLTATGYDQVLTTSRSYTVWAPTNDALAGLDKTIADDPEKLKQFIAHHIAYQTYFTNTPQSTLRIKTLSGKYITFNRDELTVDGNQIASADTYVGNGVVHVINGKLIPQMNIWEFITSSNRSLKQKAFLQSLTQTIRVDSLATQIGVDPVTGQPVYEPGTGLVVKNDFFTQVNNINSEDSLYTFFLISDENFDSEREKIKSYFTDSIPGRMDSLISWNVSKDLAFKGLYLPENLPASLTSTSNVKVNINKSAILETHRVSNGIVYVMNKLEVNVADKIKPIIIEGERARGFSNGGIINYRVKPWASGNLDLMVKDHGTAAYSVFYRVNNVYAGKYKIYWVTVNDFTTTNFQQRLSINTLNTSTLFNYMSVQLNNRNEVLVGEYTVKNYGLLNFSVISANTTNNAQNQIVLDYIKLVPVL